MKIILFLVAILFVSGSCNGDKSTNSQTTKTEGPKAAESTQLPPLPLELMKQLFNECTLIDIVFYDLPMSMSVDQKSSIQGTLRQIADSAPVLNPACNPVGHITYQINGQIFLESDFYYSEGCTYYVFYKDRQRLYANFMTQEGANSIGNLIQRGMQMRQNAGSGNQ
jgi:hypothetical protein